MLAYDKYGDKVFFYIERLNFVNHSRHFWWKLRYSLTIRACFCEFGN